MTERVGPALEQELHDISLGMNTNYLPELSKAEDLHKKTSRPQFMVSNARGLHSVQFIHAEVC